MTNFINEDFLLESKEAKNLYHGYAAKLPIIDYHCHLSPKAIAEIVLPLSTIPTDIALTSGFVL